MDTPHPDENTRKLTLSSPLPRWLAKHVNFGYDSDDIAALINSIDSSQKPQSSSFAHLPAEIILHILEFVPVDYLIDWRVICRGFRDAIDGRVLYHHLQRTELIGFVGSREARYMAPLNDEQYDQLHLLHAKFLRMEANNDARNARVNRPIWAATHAIFEVEDSWMKAFNDFTDTAKTANNGDDVSELYFSTMERLQTLHERDSFGNLSWCIKLDHAVFDADIPPDGERSAVKFEVCYDGEMTIRVAWKVMLFRFLKTEKALRCMFEEKQKSAFTFSHAEDCLREVRRNRLHASLNPNTKVDRRRKWSLRLLPPLFGRSGDGHGDNLEMVENIAIDALLLFRREAAMTSKQLVYLRQLDNDRQTMDHEVYQLDNEFRQFKAHLISRFEFSIDLPTQMEDNLPRNPIAWPDVMRSAIEERVNKWKSQQKVIRQVHALLSSSNEALAVPEDSFDDLGSEL